MYMMMKMWMKLRRRASCTCAFMLIIMTWKHVGHCKNSPDHKISVFDPHKLFLLSVSLWVCTVVLPRASGLRSFTVTLSNLHFKASFPLYFFTLLSWIYHKIDFLKPFQSFSVDLFHILKKKWVVFAHAKLAAAVGCFR